MPVDEQAICGRLREFRQFTGLSQAQVASLAGIDQRTYASYEYARSQLNYPAAWRILKSFRQLSPLWLASGDGRMLDLYFISYPTPEETGLGPRALFSVVFEISIRPLLLRSRFAWNVAPDKPFPLFNVDGSIKGRIEGIEIFSDILSGWLAARSDHQVNDFLNAILHRCSVVLDEFPRDNEEGAIRARAREMLEAEAKMRLTVAECSANLGLTDITALGNKLAMKSPMAALLGRLNRATSERGLKSKLARTMGVPLVNISQWLSGEREPGGETTLKLLQWVEQQERPKKTPDSALTPPGLKPTQQRKEVREDKPSSSGRKKK